LFFPLLPGFCWPSSCWSMFLGFTWALLPLPLPVFSDVFLLKFNLAPAFLNHLLCRAAHAFSGPEIFCGIPLLPLALSMPQSQLLIFNPSQKWAELEQCFVSWPQCEPQGCFEPRLHWDSIYGVAFGVLWPGQSRWIILTRKWFSPKVYVQEYRMYNTAAVEIIAHRGL